MKKTVFLAIMMMLSISFSTVFAAEPDKKNKSDDAIPGTERKMTEAEFNRLSKRAEEIRNMDKSEMTAKEKKELRKELREIRENVKRDGYIYIGAGTLLVIILLVILLV